MTRHLALASLALASLAALADGAAAQQNWLLGDWLNTRMDPRGITNAATAARFEPSGRLIIQLTVSGSGGSGTQTLMAVYRMTGPSSYQSRIVDYEPKQICQVVCLPVTPFIPMGTVENCNFQPLNQVAMAVSCDGQPPIRFTRQNFR